MLENAMVQGLFSGLFNSPLPPSLTNIYLGDVHSGHEFPEADSLPLLKFQGHEFLFLSPP